jgi:leucyl aminopeptidase
MDNVPSTAKCFKFYFKTKGSKPDVQVDSTHICLNREFMFLQLKSLGSRLANNNDDIYLSVSKISNRYKLYILQIIAKHVYKFEKYKTNQSVKRKIFIHDKPINKPYVLSTIAKLEMVNFVRDFQNEPANKITPQAFCRYTQNVFKRNKNISVRAMDDKEIKTNGLMLVHEMGKASINKSRFMIMEYKHPQATKTFCLVGKGVCFDAGGLDIKTGMAMTYEMKSDKTGGCTVVGIIKYASDTHMKCNIIGLVPLIENIISGDVVHAGDVVKSYNGKTVEILDTDAEGRLIMADALAYAKNYKTDYIFDLATLTGWTDWLHCDHSVSYFTTNKKLYDLMYDVGEEIGERAIGLPRWPEYRVFTKSAIADFKNYKFDECKTPGGFMASMFLYNFVPENMKNKWIHFDISNNYLGAFANGHSTLLCLEVMLRLIDT